jgi:hypothetical protein
MQHAKGVVENIHHPTLARKLRQPRNIDDLRFAISSLGIFRKFRLPYQPTRTCFHCIGRDYDEISHDTLSRTISSAIVGVRNLPEIAESMFHVHFQYRPEMTHRQQTEWISLCGSAQVVHNMRLWNIPNFPPRLPHTIAELDILRAVEYLVIVGADSNQCPSIYELARSYHVIDNSRMSVVPIYHQMPS